MKDFPIAFCRELLLPHSASQVLLERLGSRFHYEINIGYNGKLWVRAQRPSEVIFIFNALGRLVEGDSSMETVEFIMATLPQK